MQTGERTVAFLHLDLSLRDGGEGRQRSLHPSVLATYRQVKEDRIDATCVRFKLDETVRNRLTNAMRGRAVTFKEDMRTLNDVMRAAKHPKGAVQLKLREIERGTFSAGCRARSYSPLGPTPAEKQDMERAAKEKAEKEGERKEEAERPRPRRGARVAGGGAAPAPGGAPSATEPSRAGEKGGGGLTVFFIWMLFGGNCFRQLSDPA
ncbi:hypothetical protein AK812_SmicGene28391 [Symbiodinium microadriaticum]|uniref:Uncharacterized protein n=1 Tax=Symbiodinium microadriaticum TaxID=2951 RepID=A0A1Q9D4J7_SYMMI|nr:hypothetical protein AK812_SmicGene28391 [Symbiodinium microadriaticum]